MAQGSTFAVRVDNAALSWTEATADIVLRGVAVGPAWQWSMPGMAYEAIVLRATGWVLGRAVEGFLALDQVYLPAGGRFYTDDPLARDGLLIAFFSFGNRYADGSIEVGHLAFGHGGWGYATVNDDAGVRTLTTEVDGEVTVGPDGYWPEHVRFDVAGEVWEWLGDPAGRMPGVGPLPNPQSDGRVRRVGDPRTPVAWFAWGETHPSHGTRRTT